MAMPHPLDGVRAKIERAKEHVRDLDVGISTFLNDTLHTVTIRTYLDANGQPSRDIVFNGPPIPHRISIIAGEVVYQLRSSLDHLIWQLVLANNTEPVTNDLEFPIFWNNAKYPAAAERKMKGVSRSAAQLIEQLQPYRSGASFNDHPLWIINDLNIIDKHRFIIVAAGEINVFGAAELFTVQPEHLDHVITHRLTRTRTSHPNTEYELSFDIAFDTFGSRRGEALVPALQRLCEFVSGTMNTFRDEFRPITPS